MPWVVWVVLRDADDVGGRTFLRSVYEDGGMERELLLSLEGVGRRYGFRGTWVLRGVDLAIAPGALIRVEGANGTGKSTLLRVLAGIDAPSEGRVTGRPRTAYVPERFPAALPFTAAEYLTHLGAVHGLDRLAAAEVADEWLERFGAAEYARTPMAELSKGGSQKVAVAQALLAEPELLVLDEAWTGLDAEGREELERVVVERTAAGAAVVFVDHDPHRLAGIPDAVYAVEGGSLGLRTSRRGRAGRVGVGSSEAGERSYGPFVVVEARGSAGAGAGAGGGGGGGEDGRGGVQVPDGAAECAAEVEEMASGVHRFTVPEARSDALLRALLGARPPWHVVSVGPAPETSTKSAAPERPAEREDVERKEVAPEELEELEELEVEGPR